MEIVEPACFLGLPPAERWQQIYLALGGTSECFMEAPILGQMRLILEALGSETCIDTPEDFWRAWAAFLGIECVEDSRDARRQIYGAYGGDEECFEGAGPDAQMLALFQAILGGEGNWILATNFWDDNGVWVDSETWND